MNVLLTPLTRVLLLAGAALLGMSTLRAIPVFPGAIGFGSDTGAGRGGQIVRVTNLLDDYQNPPVGSFRWAVERVPGPRVIIFEVGGVIELKRNVIIRADDSSGHHGSVTIAGQTAPWPGITLKNAGIAIVASDVLIQHIAIRPGTLVRNESGWDLPVLDNRDCIAVGGTAGVVARNIVIDHVSASWATDEMVSVWSDNGGADNITFSNCIFSEPILNGGHSKGAHGYGPLSGRNATNITIARNIMAFNWGRNPLVRDLTSGAQVVNNFVYRPGVWPNAAMYFAGPTPLPGRTFAHSVVGNVIVRHPVPFSVRMGRDNGTVPLETFTTYYNTSLYFHDDLPAGSRAYLADNRVFNPQNDTWYPVDGNPYSSTIFREGPNPLVRLNADPYAGSGGTPWSPWPASEVESGLLVRAGKFPARPDPIDADVFRKIQTRTGAFVAFESDLGSEPWAPVNLATHRPLETPANPHADDDGDGYTNLEEWLHQFAAEVENVSNRRPYAKAGQDQTIFVDGQPTAEVTLDGRASFDLDGDALTYSWAWPGGAASGATPVITLPVGKTLVTLTVNDGRGGTDTARVVIEILDPPEVIALNHLTFTYNGEPKPATVTTNPEQLSYQVSYDGKPTPPTLPGAYTVVATVTEPEFEGTATGTLVIRPTVLVRHAPAINGTVDGSVQVLVAESLALNSNAVVSGDLLVPGTPVVRTNGAAVYHGTIDGPGDAAPTAHQITLNSGSRLRHVIRRVDSTAMPVVAAPPAPAGTRNVTLNQSGQSVGDFTTLRNLTLNSGAGTVEVPPGTYGSFLVNTGAVIRLGVVGASSPAEYHLQGLTLNSGALLEVVGPVVMTVAQSVTLNGSAGAAAHPEWLGVRVASGDVTLNGNGDFHGEIVAPGGMVTLNGTVRVFGSVAADRFTVNRGASLRHPADRTPPTIAITAPAGQAPVRGLVVITAEANDNVGIAAVQFMLNGRPFGAEDTVAPYRIDWDTSVAAIGGHELVAIARDFEGNTTRSPVIQVDVADQVAPTVTLIAPQRFATARGTLIVAAEANDNIGVAGVTFYRDGLVMGAEVTAPPYRIAWDSSTAPDGSHLITAVARDAGGNTTASQAVKVAVWNGAAANGYTEDFNGSEAQGWASVSGAWSVLPAGGYYTPDASEDPAIAIYDGQAWEKGFVFSASLRTSRVGANNRLGLVYHYVDHANYAYVIFNSAGLAEIHRVVNGGAPIVVATVQANDPAIDAGIAANAWFTVRIVRSGSTTTVFVNEKRVFDAVEQPELGAGKLGFITRFNSSAQFDNARVSTQVPLAVFDTFEDGDISAWFSDGAGTWVLDTDGATKVLRQRNASVVANRAVRHDTSHSHQSIEADVKLRAVNGNNRFFGVAARYVSPGDYYYFILRTNNTIELKELVSGVAVNLAPPQPFTVVPGRWYRLRLEVVGDILKAYINGELKMQGTSSSFASGSGALLTFWSDVVFDDVHIDADPDRPLLVADDFEDGDEAGWSVEAGAWAVVSDGSLVYRQAELAGSGRTLMGDVSAVDQIIELDVKTNGFGSAAGSLGLLARYIDPENHYAVVLTAAGTIELRRTAGGTTSVLASAPGAVTTGVWRSLRVTAVGESLKVYLDGQHVLEAVDAAHASGRVGLLTQSASATFDDVLVTAP
jgi:cytoskeletal protein CcmA (bactofilin family)